MEEFRAFLADRLAITLINRKQVTIEHFEPRPGGAVYLNEKGRKEVVAAYQKRKQEEADKMSRLFAEGDHEKRRSERVRKMDEELKDFKKRKPRDPFSGESGD